jgi:hypothetical protein
MCRARVTLQSTLRCSAVDFCLPPLTPAPSPFPPFPVPVPLQQVSAGLPARGHVWAAVRRCPRTRHWLALWQRPARLTFGRPLASGRSRRLAGGSLPSRCCKAPPRWPPCSQGLTCPPRAGLAIQFKLLMAQPSRTLCALPLTQPLISHFPTKPFAAVRCAAQAYAVHSLLRQPAAAASHLPVPGELHQSPASPVLSPQVCSLVAKV